MLQSTFTKAALCAAGGAVAAMTAVGPAVAVQDTNPVVPAKSADQMAPEQGGGKVHKGVVKHKTNIHKHPSERSRVIGRLHRGQIIKIKCKVVKHRDWRKETWYKLAERRGWVNARNVRAFSHIPHCRFMPKPPMPPMNSMDNAQGVNSADALDPQG